MKNFKFKLKKINKKKKEEIIKNTYKAILDLNELIELSFALPPEKIKKLRNVDVSDYPVPRHSVYFCHFQKLLKSAVHKYSPCSL